MPSSNFDVLICSRTYFESDQNKSNSWIMTREVSKECTHLDALVCLHFDYKMVTSVEAFLLKIWALVYSVYFQ